MSVFGTIKYTNTDIFLLFFNIIIGVEDSDDMNDNTAYDDKLRKTMILKLYIVMVLDGK